jgi:streptogramin lyase
MTSVAVALVLAAMLCVAESAAGRPPEGNVEEFPVVVPYRWSLGNLAAGPEGSIWYLGGTSYGLGFGTIERITPSGLMVGRMGTGVNSLGSDITEGPDKDMWVTVRRGVASEPGAIMRITPAEEEETFTIGNTQTPSCCEGNSPGPEAIAAGTNGELWFTDSRPNSSGDIFIGSITTAGVVTQHVVPTGSATDLPVSSSPMGIAPGLDGSVWFTDDGVNELGENLIGKISPSGTITEYPLPPVGSAPAAIALGSEGDMWFTEPGIEKLGRITPSGEVTEFSAPLIAGGPESLIQGADGNIWFIESPYGQQTLARITPSGVISSFTPSFVPGGFVGSLTAGPEGAIWFVDQHFAPVGDDGYAYVGRFTIPYAPKLQTPPAIAGTPITEEALTASPGTWSGEADTYAYQWQQCDAQGVDCSDIAGQTHSRYLLTAGDDSRTIRVSVTASNDGGSSTSISTPTEAVQARPSPAAVVVRLAGPPAPVTPVSEVGVTTTWHFSLRHGLTIVRSLMLHHAPRGATVVAQCDGQGCAFAATPATRLHHPDCHDSHCSVTLTVAGTSEFDLGPLFARARMRPGARILIIVEYAGTLGRKLEFLAHGHSQPTVHVGCLAPKSLTTPSAC